MNRKIKIAQYGCGKMSVYLMRYVLEKGAELVAAFDMNPAVIGKDIGEIMGSDHVGIKVSDAKDTDKIFISALHSLAGAVGIEPTSMVLETTVLPLNYAPLVCGAKKTAENYYSICMGRAQAKLY